MGNGSVQVRKLVIKEGMKPSDVINSDKATDLQKKYAAIFDADGNGYSKQEAAVFNATTISDKGKKGVSLWTRYADGTVREFSFKGDAAAFKFTPLEEVKPYTKKVAKPAQKGKAFQAKQTETKVEYPPKAPDYTPFGSRTSIVDFDTLEFKTSYDSVEYMKKAPYFSLTYRVSVRDGELNKRIKVRDEELEKRINIRNREREKRIKLREVNEHDPLIAESYMREETQTGISYNTEQQKCHKSYEKEELLTSKAYEDEINAQRQHCKYVNYRQPY